MGIVVNATPSSLFNDRQDHNILRFFGSQAVLSVSFVTVVGVFLLIIKPVNDEFGYDGTSDSADELSYGV